MNYASRVRGQNDLLRPPGRGISIEFGPQTRTRRSLWSIQPPESDRKLRHAGRSLYAKSDRSALRQKSALFDHLVGAGQERFGDDQPKRLGGLEIDDEFEFVRLLDRNIGWLRAV
jgi:hypothetical protein